MKQIYVLNNLLYIIVTNWFKIEYNSILFNLILSNKK